MSTFKDLRKLAGFTQHALAAKSGLRQATISALENGRSVAHPGTVSALAAALKTDADTISKAISMFQRSERNHWAEEMTGPMHFDIRLV